MQLPIIISIEMIEGGMEYYFVKVEPGLSR
jgi:hypothetical protein